MTNQSFAHSAFYAGNDYGRHGNMAYKNNCLISYSTVIGFWDRENEFTIISPHYYSNTTARHKSYFSCASPYRTFYLNWSTDPNCEYHDFINYNGSPEKIKSIIEQNIENIQDWYKKVLEKRTYYSNKDRKFQLEVIYELSDFCIYVERRVKSKKKIVTENIKKKLQKIKDNLNSLTAKKCKTPKPKSVNDIKKEVFNCLCNYKRTIEIGEEKVKSLINKLELGKLYIEYAKTMQSYYGISDVINKLIKFKDKRFDRSGHNSPTYIGVDVINDCIKTSKGVRLEKERVIRHLKNMWLNKDFDLKKLVGLKYNHAYHISEVTDYSIRIGCHLIPFFVLDDLCEELGLK